MLSYYIQDIMKRRKIQINKPNRFLLLIVTVIIILLLMGIEYFIQVVNNREQSYRTAEVLITQVKGVQGTDADRFS